MQLLRLHPLAARQPDPGHLARFVPAISHALLARTAAAPEAPVGAPGRSRLGLLWCISFHRLREALWWEAWGRAQFGRVLSLQAGPRPSLLEQPLALSVEYASVVERMVLQQETFVQTLGEVASLGALPGASLGCGVAGLVLSNALPGAPGAGENFARRGLTGPARRDAPWRQRGAWRYWSTWCRWRDFACSGDVPSLPGGVPRER